MEKADLYSELLQPLTFSKSEKLCSKKHIEELYKNGSSTFLYPFRIVSLNSNTESQNFPKVLISVPKRNFKKAVDRNRLKRQIREAYRLNKQRIFAQLDGTQIPDFLAIGYIAKEKLPFDVLESKLIAVLSRFRRT
jgi:ribonuclease P protein component